LVEITRRFSVQSEELNKYWNTVVDIMQDGVMIVDPKGTIVSVNRALESITDYKKEEMVGRPCSILHCDICEMARARPREGKEWCDLFESGSLHRRRCTIEKKGGSYLHILKNASVIKDETGEVIGAVETFTDVTEIVERDKEIEAFRRELSSEDRFHGILGASSAMQRIFELITNAARSDAPVVIFGESGTGKELAARAIHDAGPRRQMPFIKVNCAALAESLLESELFGHVKGAYTGAYRDRKGRFEAAHGGDIFLDEIGDLPLSTQAKLLRVLEEKVIERVGDNSPTPVDVRIITATHKNLKALVDGDSFRADLFFRINVIPITIPPLRERVEDIPLLSEAFFKRIQLKSGKKIQGISNEAMAFLMGYPWPGNVRELKSAFEYAFVTCQESSIQPYHLPPNICSGKRGAAVATRPAIDKKEIKKERLIEALKRAGGNRSEVARMLGISRVTVWKQIRQFGIDL